MCNVVIFYISFPNRCCSVVTWSFVLPCFTPNCADAGKVPCNWFAHIVNLSGPLQEGCAAYLPGDDRFNPAHLPRHIKYIHLQPGKYLTPAHPSTLTTFLTGLKLKASHLGIPIFSRLSVYNQAINTNIHLPPPHSHATPPKSIGCRPTSDTESLTHIIPY